MYCLFGWVYMLCIKYIWVHIYKWKCNNKVKKWKPILLKLPFVKYRAHLICLQCYGICKSLPQQKISINPYFHSPVVELIAFAASILLLATWSPMLNAELVMLLAVQMQVRMAAELARQTFTMRMYLWLYPYQTYVFKVHYLEFAFNEKEDSREYQS